ncbi:hypothetical protein CDD83_1189 [Cordyceps sp. RAO-2017]|nr:hypothetical protein CDD83_1189 [Cordyceps sp. RAO-2017]
MTDLSSRLKPKPKRVSLILSGNPPTRFRAADDLLANLSPSSIVDALTSPAGALRSCIDAAPAADREFAIQSALASQRVWEWLAELQVWSWTAGFQDAHARLRPASTHLADPRGEAEEYTSSLSAGDMARYERRIGEIQSAMEELALEDIKSHVLTNHIIPLSRPSTPMTDSSPSSCSSMPFAYNKMEDLTALVAAIVIQTLPNLARLSSLLRIWTVRLRVLRRIPPFLRAVRDAEVALESGGAAIAPRPASSTPGTIEPEPPSLRQQDFEVMRRVLEGKVAEPGRMLDYLLDCLDGMPDTLPDAWLDRVEALERRHSDWLNACEETMRQSGQASPTQEQAPPSRSASTRQACGSDSGSPSAFGNLPQMATADSAIALTASPDSQLDGCGAKTETDWESSSPCGRQTGDGSPASGSDGSQSSTDDFADSKQNMTPVEEQDEQLLPPLRESSSQNSLTSRASTVNFGASSHFGALSDPPDMSASPVMPVERMRKARYMGISPPSSPPPPPQADSPRLAPPKLLDSPVIAPIAHGGDSMFFKSPADQSFADDFDDSLSMSEGMCSLAPRDGDDDAQLQQQISEIIESIPAKIKLAKEPQAINLNPPDIQLPRLGKKSSRDVFKRSASNLSVASSSRAGTPSFTLSPAKNPRSRHHRAHQAIKVYHLSRSTGEPPIKLLIRCVGEHGERVMVRVGGGWADLSEYLKEYASHHGRRSTGMEKANVEVRDVPRGSSGFAGGVGSSPPRPTSAAADCPPGTPLQVRKTRRSVGATGCEAPRLRPKTPAGGSSTTENAPSSEDSTRSRSSSRLSWFEDDSSFLGLAGPTGKKIEMSEENRAWVESVKEKVRLASGDARFLPGDKNRFGDLGKVGGTKRLFRKTDDRSSSWR